MIRRSFLMLLLVLAVWTTHAQSTGHEGRIASDFRREGEQLQNCKSFDLRSIAACAQGLATAQPVHIAFGGLAPQNGFAAGLAFVEHKNCPDASSTTSHPFCPTEWRFTWNADAVASPNGSWRAGVYMKAFRLSGGPITTSYGTPKKEPSAPLFHSAPLFNLYAQGISLNRIYYYGLGPDTAPAAKTAFGQTQTIVGASAIIPTGILSTSLYGEINGRLPQIRGNHGESVPSIETGYSELTAPGLTSQPAFLHLGEGLRVQPAIFRQHLHLHYALGLQEFVGVSDSRLTFRRWTADLGHDFPLDRKVQLSGPNDRIGPDSCTTDPSNPCPSPTNVPHAFDHEGTVSFRLLMTGSVANAGRSVPFYFDPTVGGSDLNGQPILRAIRTTASARPIWYWSAVGSNTPSQGFHWELSSPLTRPRWGYGEMISISQTCGAAIPPDLPCTPGVCQSSICFLRGEAARATTLSRASAMHCSVGRLVPRSFELSLLCKTDGRNARCTGQNFAVS